MWKNPLGFLGALFLSFLLCFRPATSQECQAGDETCNQENKPQKRQQQEDEEPSSVWKVPKNPSELAQQAANRAKNGEGTRIVSNLISDFSLLEKLADHRLWYQCYEETRGKNTYWLDYNAVPKTIFEKIAVNIWKNQPILRQLVAKNSQIEDDTPPVAGYEIWCNILTPQGPLDWHIDKDQIAFSSSQGMNVTTPYFGSVFYGFPHDFSGGFLELTTEDADSMPDATQDPDPASIERIDAEYNRLVVFNASKFHRVSPIFSGTRVTLAVNLWKERPGVADYRKRRAA